MCVCVGKYDSAMEGCTTQDNRRPGTVVLPYLLAALPFTWLTVAVIVYHLDFPYLDQWEFVPLLQKMYEGRLRPVDLWAQHNEHRLIFPRLLMLVMARLSNWNIGWELATNLVLGACLFVVLAWRIERTRSTAGRTELIWLLPIVSLFVFSMSQWENWFLGWQVQEFLNILAVACGLLLLSSNAERMSAFRFAGACVAGIVATYSFANGLLFWPIGMAVVLVGRNRGDGEGGRLLWCGLWAVVGLITAASYLYDYQTPSYHPSLVLPFNQPLDYLVYVLTYLGAPLSNFSVGGAAFTGGAGIVFLVALTTVLVRLRNGQAQVWLPYVALAAYAVGSAAITGLGRVGFGAEQAMSPRYITFSNMLWIANLVLAVVVFGDMRSTGRVFERCPERSAKTAAATLAGVLVLLLLFCSAYGLYRWTERYNYRLEARQVLLDGTDTDMLSRIHPEPWKIIRRRPVLEKYRLSIFNPR